MEAFFPNPPTMCDTRPPFYGMSVKPHPICEECTPKKPLAEAEEPAWTEEKKKKGLVCLCTTPEEHRLATRRKVRGHGTAPKNKWAKRLVLDGRYEKTASGLRKADIVETENGDAVSRKKQMIGQKNFHHVRPWHTCFMKARKKLGLEGWIPCKKGSLFYSLTKFYYGQVKNGTEIPHSWWQCPKPDGVKCGGDAQK